MVIEDILFYPAILLIMMLVLIPLVLIVYGIIKRRRRIVIICTIILVLAALSLYGILSFLWEEFAFILIGLLCIGLLLLTPIVMLIYGLVKNNKKIVKINACIVLLVAFFIGGYYLLFPTHYPYMDLWIIGKTEAEIVEKYGEPYIGYDSYDRTIGYQTGSYAFLGEPYYYYIHFDETGKAVNCEISIYIKGG